MVQLEYDRFTVSSDTMCRRRNRDVSGALHPRDIRSTGRPISKLLPSL